MRLQKASLWRLNFCIYCSECTFDGKVLSFNFMKEKLSKSDLSLILIFIKMFLSNDRLPTQFFNRLVTIKGFVNMNTMKTK
jgi:hypothetical protein